MKRMIWAAPVLMLAMLMGCNSGMDGKIATEYVEGIVKLDGSPLVGASLAFYPVDASGKIAFGSTDETGKYTLTTDGGADFKGALPGEYKVTIVKKELPPPASADVSDAPVDLTDRSKWITQEAQSKQETTDLVATVKPGKNIIPFDITSK